ncbi:rust resistance kinase Lr10-like [Cryptomeria japonica]|uniref:rust resistance kinase Lr10-like n=1 Tax=Cryptomeria japonica TaxID=3369 RepID=UPI0027DA8458|nr:rust resistance kinase Lr10-like [Cryptomeria japonica]
MESFTFHGCIYSLCHSSLYMRCWVRCRCLLLILLPCIILFFILFPIFLYSDTHSYPSYQTCSPHTCNHSIIKYPFNDCSHTTAQCRRNQTSVLDLPSMKGFCNGDTYRVVGGITESSYTNRTVHVTCDQNLLDGCAGTFNDVRFFDDEFYLSDKYKWGTVIICNREPAYSNIIQSIKCLECRSRNDLCYFVPWNLASYYYPSQLSAADKSCGGQYAVVIPSNKSYKITDEKILRERFHKGFEVKWDISDQCSSCEISGGICYHVFRISGCICPDGPHKYNCSDGKLLDEKKWWMTSKFKAAIGVISGIFIISTIILIWRRINRKKREQQEELDIEGFMDPLDSRPFSVENFLHAAIPTRYYYHQIKRYTNNFAVRLGQGGFGTVFKGELPNGCIIAVKILEKSKYSRIQFLNEVVTIGRIHHLHLVRLLGFCIEGSKRALIYEYMVNGSLEKYIHGDDQTVLNWKQLHSIAMGTARGIAYLHDECRNRILHCDIKPHNVLLDANFSPKVADFGLAKLTNREDSHVSLTGAGGTPGYAAPEVWSKTNGPVTDRSDVYSYGMLVMEMVGGRKNLDIKATRSSKFYYPEWAFKQVEMGAFEKLRGKTIEDDEEVVIAKKLSMLGLWCIQYDPSQRPPMSRVIQMLEGAVDTVIPPQPFPVDTPVQITEFVESSSSM